MRNSIRKIGALSQKINPLVLSQNHHRQAAVESQRVAQSASAQASSHGGSSERRQRVRSNRANGLQLSLEAISSRANAHEHKIDIGDENTDLLGQCLVSGKLTPDKKYSKSKEDSVRRDEKSRKPRGEVNSKLTEKAFIWGSHSLNLSDIVAVSYSEGLRRFTIHAYPLAKKSWISSKTERKQKDLHFLAANAADAIRWVSAFADLQCFVNCLPHPLLSSKPHDSELSLNDFPPAVPVKCKVSPVMLVILNPRSGRGRSSKLYYGKVEPIFKVAGFSLEVIETTSAGHARNIAKTYDLIKCRDGIICVGGDGIVNEVLNGLISRDDPKEAMSVPIGIIPAGSDNSLVWTVLGVKDPISAAVAIVKGGLTATDVFAVEWISSGAIHAGLTVAYYGFVSDVLELSEKYQKRFGPLRYFVAGALKFFCLPKYDYVVEYLPVPEPSINNSKNASQGGNADMSENNLNNCGRRANAEGMPRASSLSSIDSILSTSNRSTSNRLASEIDDITSGTSGTYASTEPSDYVRGIDPKTKRMSSGKHNVLPEPEEVVHPPVPGLITPTRSRKVKLNVDKGWTGAGTANDFTRSAYGNPGAFDREEISSTVSDPGPGHIWDAEPRWDEGPKWDAEPKWDEENSLDVKESIDEMIIINEVPRREEEKWVTSHGPFLGVLVCNHPCRTVQNLRTQVLAPRAEHDDNALDMLLVRGLSRINLLRFFLLMQFGRHLSLPYVEYVKVKAVRISPGKNEHKGCGIDGELLQLNGPVSTTLLPEQIRLIGKPARSAT